MEHALSLWNELGFPSIELKQPWFGEHLGRWAEEDRQDADRALRGEHDVTGKLREAQRQKLW